MGMPEEILAASCQSDHRESLELEATRSLAIALVDHTILIDTPVAECAHGLPVRLKPFGIDAGESLDGLKREIVRQIPRHPVHIAESNRRVLPVGTPPVGRLYDDPVHDLLLLLGHPLAPEVESQPEVHLGDQTMHSAPAGDRTTPVIG